MDILISALDNKVILGALATMLSAGAGVFYIISVLQKRTRPHILTWLVWGLGSGVIFAVQFVKHAGAGSWSTAYTCANCLVIAALALWYGEKNITFSDKISFTLALASIPLWFLTHDPLYSVVVIILTELLGFYPTFRKSYDKPFEERLAAYVLGATQFVFSLLAMQRFSLAAALYPIVCIFTNGSFIVFTVVRRQRVA